MMFVPLFAARPRDGLETPVKTLVSVASDQLAHACQQVGSMEESAAGVNVLEMDSPVLPSSFDSTDIV